VNPLRIGFIEPHLRPFGGIRRVVEFGNALIRQGHEVAYYLPPDQSKSCDWIRCDGRIRDLERDASDELDAVVFNHEPQWIHVDRFPRARLKVYYILHYAILYAKPGSWESYRAPVDLRLANSNWTADRIAEEIGERPEVVHGGINPEHFRPVEAEKVYEVLCYGDRKRFWKGTEDIEKACGLAGLALERYDGKGIPQELMAVEYAKARVFAVGSWFEGFGQPGLEALACGVPLVTTDCGGCRDYAVDGQTALVVPPRDPGAMAEALRRVLEDAQLRERLTANGLEMVRTKFDWDRSAHRLAEVLSDALENKEQVGKLAREKARPQDAPLHETLVADDRGRDLTEDVEAKTRILCPPEDPSEREALRQTVKREQQKTVTVSILSFDQLHYTRDCIESIRRNTQVPCEIVVVDNGSAPEVVCALEDLADVLIANQTNQGFARGHNQALAAAKGEYIAFLNNDTLVPSQWLSRLIESLHLTGDVGLVSPVFTECVSHLTRREKPRDLVREVIPFALIPSGVCYFGRTRTFRALGGWNEVYRVASGEDNDLCYTAWRNGLKILVDERVLIDHVGKGTASVKLENWRDLWDENRQLFFERWLGEDRFPEHMDYTYLRGLGDIRRFEAFRDRAAEVAKQIEQREEGGGDVPGLLGDSVDLARSMTRELDDLRRQIRRERAGFLRVFSEYHTGLTAARAGSRQFETALRNQFVKSTGLLRFAYDKYFAGPLKNTVFERIARRIYRVGKRDKDREPEAK